VVNVFELTGHPTVDPRLCLVLADRREHKAAVLRCSACRSDQLAGCGAAGGDSSGAESTIVSLEAKGRIDALISLAKDRRERLKERNQYQWRMTLAYWAFLVAGTYYIYPRPDTIPLIIGLIFAALVHIYFMVLIRKRSRLDSEFAFYYIEHVESSLSLLPDKPRDRPDWEKALKLKWNTTDFRQTFVQDFWWSGMSVIVTLALSLTAYWAIGTFERPLK
jgi:hypothetical protein